MIDLISSDRLCFSPAMVAAACLMTLSFLVCHFVMQQLVSLASETCSAPRFLSQIQDTAARASLGV